jgi:hypothetical protein
VLLSIGSVLTVLWKYILIMNMNWYIYTVDIEKKAFIQDIVWPCGCGDNP